MILFLYVKTHIKNKFMNYNFFDIHSHLHDKAFDEDRHQIIMEMQKNGIGTITIGTDLEESKKAIALAEKYENIFASVGCHPNDSELEIFAEEKYLELAKHEKVVTIGECGLDYFYLKDTLGGVSFIVAENQIQKEKQKEIFKKQINIAINVAKPLMLHGRPSMGTMDAYEDMLSILEEVYKIHGEKLKGNAHFFAGNTEIAKRFFDLGFTISFSGVITFVKEYEELLHFVPLNMIHAETDSPYVAPAPYRGKRNSPLYLQEIVAKMAVVRQENFEELRLQLLENAKRVFGV